MQKVRMIFVSIISFLILTGNSFSTPSNQDSTGTKKIPYRVPRVESSINVDGHLDDALWTKAVSIDANIEVRPGENIPAPVKTKALLAYNETHIFVAFIASDPEPSKIRARYCDRDNIWDDDWVIILFDTFNDQRRTYDFGCNPLGIQTDFIETNTGGGGEWDAIWESDGRITEDGYIVEMAIPFSSLNFQTTPEDQIWGFDLVRSYPRNVRHHIGAFPRDRSNNCYMCQSLKLIGFKGASPGKNIEIDPTFNMTLSQERTERDDGSYGAFKDPKEKYDPGITAHWGITPSLTLSGTINPDFSNIEADILQLDINNQFAIYYPEMRPFFLESSDFFNTPMNAVHTRTLADPNWGLKLGGRQGIHTIGFFSVQDNMTNFLFPGVEGSSSGSKDYKSQGSALRYKVDVSESSNIGLIATDREGKNYFNRVGGIDGDFRFTKTDLIRFQVLTSATQYPDSIISEFNQPQSGFAGTALEGLYVHDTKDYELYVFHKQVEEDFRADLGFVTQAGYKYSTIGGEYKWQRDSEHWFTWLSVEGNYEYKQDYHDNILRKGWELEINYQGPMESHSHFTVLRNQERYDDIIFDLTSMHACYGFRPIASLFAHIFMAYGDQIDYSNTQKGTRLQLNPYTDFNIGLHIKAEVGYTYEHLDVPGGRLYKANISHLKLVYQLNKEIFFRGILQYVDYNKNVDLYNDIVNSETQSLFSQFLFSYKINPQTVFFLGYSDNYYGNQDINTIQTNRTLFAKIGYAFVP